MIGGLAKASTNTVARSVGGPVSNIVLVHGAFTDGSSWRGVYDHLTSRGYRVTVVQIPLTSFEADVAATRRIIGRQKGPVILVGHAYGGAIITEVGVDECVAGLVYVSALAPDVGESASDQLAGVPTHPEFVIEPGRDGFGFVSMELFQPGYAADLSEADAAFLRDSQVPASMTIFTTPLVQAAWHSKSSWFVVSTRDRVIDPDLLRQQAARIGAEVVEVEGSHISFVTHPRVVADVIDRAARSVVHDEAACLG